MKRINIHLDKCVGCLSCETACVTAHQDRGVPVTSDSILASFSKMTMPTTRIWVESRPDVDLPTPITCRHCVEPVCVDVCSIGAMHVADENGTVINRIERCAGCWMCIMVCPYGAIEKLAKIANKCDLCEGRDEPACVESCPEEALEFIDVEQWAQHERKQLASMISGSVTC